MLSEHIDKIFLGYYDGSFNQIQNLKHNFLGHTLYLVSFLTYL